MVEHFYVGKVPDAETTTIPSDVFDLCDITKYGIVNFAGLDRPDADISRSALAGANASRISGSQISERNIVLTIRPWISAEINRQELYDHLPYDTDLRFYIVTENRCVFIDGYVEKLGGGGFTKNVTDIQLSIICPFPWFQSIRQHTAQLKAGDNIIRNNGDIPSGFRLEVEGHANMVQLVDFKLTAGSETFATKADTSVIAPTELNTVSGKRTFKCSNTGHTSTGTWKPSFSYLASDTKWPKIPGGTQTINVSYTSGGEGEYIFDNMNTLYWRDTYSGV